MRELTDSLHTLLFADGYQSWLPLLIVVFFFSAVRLALKAWANRNRQQNLHKRYQQQAQSVFLYAITVLLVIISAPIDEELQGQLLSLFGIVFSAALALSSTTIMGNLLAGIMLRVVNSFSIGDFVRIDEQLGRVSEFGLLHVEVQTEDSDLLTIPNLVLVQRPFTVIRASGTVIHSEVSLGYDVAHQDVEAACIRAADEAGLNEAFVQVESLGDYSVVYSVHARLIDSKKILSAKSRLNKALIDHLHQAGIEIVSPAFMNQRVYQGGQPFRPPEVSSKAELEPQGAIEEVLFDKAGQAEMHKRLTSRLSKIQSKLDELEKERASFAEGSTEREALEPRVLQWQKRLAQVEFLLEDKQ